MSLERDVYAGIEAIYLADTGSGGLNESASDHRVNPEDFSRHDDPDDRQNGNYPSIRVECDSSEERDAFGVGAGRVFGRFHVVARRNTNAFATMDRVTYRIRTIYHTVAPADTSDWNFSPIIVTRTSKGPSSATEFKRVVEFTLVATRASGRA